MRIIFKNEKEKERLKEILEKSIYCPSMFRLEEVKIEECDRDGTQGMCGECWRMALAEMEVEEQ